MMVLGAVGVSLGLVAGDPWRRWLVGAGLVVAAPLGIGLPLIGVVAAQNARRRRSIRRAEEADAVVDELTIARLLSVATAAGMTVPAGLALIEPYVSTGTARAIARMRRAATVDGWAPTLDAAAALEEGPAELWRVLARSQSTGAPIGPAIASYLEDADEKATHDALAKARRLPVTLLVPLTLLTLPGCVVLVVGPGLLAGFERIVGPLL